jgi:hypothetical protein
MAIDQARLGDRLAHALLAHDTARKAPRAFDRVARQMVGDEVAFAGDAAGTAIVEAAVRLKRLVQDTWTEDTKKACKARKIYHRAWLRGLVAGAVERGLSAPVLGQALAIATVPVAYEEAIPLPVYAYSLGYGFGQAWATVSRDERDRQEWLAGLQRGVDEAENHLRAGAAYHGVDLDPDLVPPDERAVDNVEAGFHLGSFTGFFTK